MTSSLMSIFHKPMHGFKEKACSTACVLFFAAWGIGGLIACIALIKNLLN